MRQEGVRVASARRQDNLASGWRQDDVKPRGARINWGGGWMAGAGLEVGLKDTAVEGSHILGSVCLALVVVCGGLMARHFVMGMWTRVYVAAAVVAVPAGGKGVPDAVGVEFWWWGQYCCCCGCPWRGFSR